MALHKDKSDRNLRKPPDYFARRTQYRLLLGVFLLMAALVWLMNALDLNDIGLSENDLNQSSASQSFTKRENQLRHFGQLHLDELPSEQQMTIQLRKELWGNILDDLEDADVLELLVLVDDLAVGTPVKDTLKEQWHSLFEAMDEKYRQFHSNTLLGATTEPSPFNPTQRAALLKATANLQQWWTEQVRQTFASPFDQSGESTGDIASEIQQLIDALAVSRIEDNKSFRRSGEIAWYRMYQQLKHMRNEYENLDRLSFGATSFAQLYRQREFQRGRLLTVKGNVRQAYKVTSVANPFGIDEFYVLTIRVQNDDSPVIVYCLEAPSSFPNVPNKDPNGDTLLINQNDEIRLTGYFFKIWAYSTPEGTYTAPLIIADTFKWIADTGKSPEESQTSTSPDGFPTWLVFAIAGIVAVGVCGYVFTTSRRQSLATLAQRNLVPTDDTLEIAADQVIPSAAATLKELESDDSITGNVDLNTLLAKEEEEEEESDD